MLRERRVAPGKSAGCNPAFPIILFFTPHQPSHAGCLLKSSVKPYRCPHLSFRAVSVQPQSFFKFHPLCHTGDRHPEPTRNPCPLKPGSHKPPIHLPRPRWIPDLRFAPSGMTHSGGVSWFGHGAMRPWSHTHFTQRS